MSDLKEKLDSPVTSCTSSSETYKCLQDHMVRGNTHTHTICWTIDVLLYYMFTHFSGVH